MIKDHILEMDRQTVDVYIYIKKSIVDLTDLPFENLKTKHLTAKFVTCN